MGRESRDKRIYRVTLVGSLGNMALLILKFVAGIVGRSSAMIADAIHSLSDFITDLIVIIFVRISSKPSDSCHRYGHGKYETLATAIIAISLFVVGVGIFWDSSTKIWDCLHGKQLEAPGMIAFWAAIVSIAVKESLYHYTKLEAVKLNSKAMEANAWHHRSDAFSSIATTIGIGGAIFFGVKGRVMDPIAAALVSVFILRVAYQLFKPALDELLERSLPQEQEDAIIDVINDTPGAENPHNLRTRRIGSYAAVDVHVRMDPNITVAQSHDITRTIEAKIRQLLGSETYVTIHVEPWK